MSWKMQKQEMRKGSDSVEREEEENYISSQQCSCDKKKLKHIREQCMIKRFTTLIFFKFAETSGKQSLCKFAAWKILQLQIWIVIIYVNQKMLPSATTQV